MGVRDVAHAKGGGSASRAVKQGEHARSAIVNCAAASIAEVKLPLVLKVIFERHEVNERC